jgi:predicted N-acetyltransferase YhbS
MSIVIREARAGDLEAVARLLATVFEHVGSPAGAPISLESGAALDRYLQDFADFPRSPLGTDTFLAEDPETGAVVGLGVLDRPYHPPRHPGGSYSDPWPRGWATLQLLAVAADFRRRGVGLRLAQACVARARALGAPVVGLHGAEIFPASRHICRRLGWLRARAYDYLLATEIYAEAYILPLAFTPQAD